MFRWPAAWLAIVLSLCTTAAVPHSSRAEAAMPAPFPGDPAPSLKIGARLQAGLFDTVRPVNGRQTTVLVFFASWDPLSRTVLPILDAQQAASSAQGVRFLAIAEDKPEEVRLYLEQAKLRSLAVACDQDRSVLRSYRGDQGDTPIPYAVISDASDRLLWVGPVVDSSSNEDPLARFTRAVEETADGRFDIAAARQAEVRRGELEALPEALARLVEEGKLDEVQARAKAALGSARPDDPPGLLVEALARTAWFLLQEAPVPTDRAALSLEVTAAAMAEGGAGRRDLLHMHAQALFATGQLEAAVEEQQKALAAPYRVGVRPNDEDCRRVLARYRQALAEKRGEPIPAEPPSAPEPAPPTTLTREQAQQDLRALEEELRRGYSAYDDTAWRLAGEGSSAAEYHRLALDHLSKQEEWPYTGFAQFVNDYLRVYQDSHINIIVPSPQGGNSQLRPLVRAEPYFADLRVQADGERMVIVKASDSALVGRELVGVPVVDSPITMRPDKVYLFPTLPRQPGRREYLVGVFSADEAETAAVSLRGASGTMAGAEQVPLALHRGRVPFHKGGWDEFMKAPPWSLTFDPLPVLTVRRMSGDGLEGMAETAVKLRDLPVVILDLRGNGGGDDGYALRWGGHFTTDQPRIYEGGGPIQLGETNPLLRWQSAIWTWPVVVSEAATKRYDGRLFALMDTGTCSSGESFAAVAMGVKGALLLGENSGGFGTYGNINGRVILPNSRLTIVYSQSKFVPAGRPFREGAGYFPDYWLDTEDAVGEVGGYLQKPGAGSGRESKVESRE